ncbi:hypothetical protein PUNSTDRAFT_141553 [Punctularia strigosozonata HHB-11173 SS5]|uniref:uncharacterized protein n=1 Tax=Punctularia strigosozonata (strain HHB-11173) TaxID=741275 RepID=UPI00044169FB|nr:uncharacterized protein PUNSTDRAFT_141553 [Punctularia strigosozonata HHB-11173 SS5]EIN13026.1 hypothetical protein PUNSTDRAFT_141553 [Punctularia strigosozonata HHB-11173 SS5]
MSAPSDHPPGPTLSQPTTDASHSASDAQSFKRTYLTSLSKDRIIEICLLLDKHVSADAQPTIWPVDVVGNREASSSSETIILKQEPQTEPAQPLAGPSTQPQADALLHPQTNGSAPLLLTKSASPFPERPPPPPPVVPYQHVPYGFPTHHTPYYTGTGTVGATSYGSATTSSTYPYSRQQSQPAAPANGSAGADLPSYEDMIVEGLGELGASDPEGAAPKTLFNWMSARWPLQINFRPSASQALQKAYKRGRLEKNQNGKYRLNPTWGGGSTSRRTTRRPQTQSQAAAASPPVQPSPSPFTRTPLQHTTPAPASFSSTSTGTYTYGSQIQYNAYTPASYAASASPPTISHEMNGLNALNTLTVPKTEPVDPAASAAVDAWDAAQRILSAFNLDPLCTARMHDDMEPAMVGKGKEREEAPAVDDSGASPEARAALQAQLTLLASQLTEIAEEEGVDIASDLAHGWSMSVTEPERRADGEIRPKQEDMEMTLVDLNGRVGHEGGAG